MKLLNAAAYRFCFCFVLLCRLPYVKTIVVTIMPEWKDHLQKVSECKSIRTTHIHQQKALRQENC